MLQRQALSASNRWLLAQRTSRCSDAISKALTLLEKHAVD